MPVPHFKHYAGCPSIHVANIHITYQPVSKVHHRHLFHTTSGLVHKKVRT